MAATLTYHSIDPFLSGVYAGNPDTLVTRYALPKLYNLEQRYGSFIRGSIAKAKEPKSARDRLATKKVFLPLGLLHRSCTGAGSSLHLFYWRGKK